MVLKYVQNDIDWKVMLALQSAAFLVLVFTAKFKNNQAEKSREKFTIFEDQTWIVSDCSKN